MDYQRLYDSIIEKARLRDSLLDYSEKHHVIPKSLGGSDEVHNIAILTAREHFVCHYLLAKMYEYGSYSWYKMNHAFMMMKCVSGNQPRYFNSRLYSYLKNNFSKVMSEQQRGTKNSQHGTRWIYNIDIQASRKIPKNEILPSGWNEGRKIKWNNVRIAKCIKCNNVRIAKCIKCNNDFEQATKERFCSVKCKNQQRADDGNIQKNSDMVKLKAISKNYTVYDTLIQNNDFIVEAKSNNISTRSILEFLEHSDSGGNYKTIKDFI